MVIIRDISFHISVSTWREYFYLLKNCESLLACFTLSSLLLTFFKREVVVFFTITVAFETKVLYFQMQISDVSGRRRRRILLLANKPHRDKPEQNIEQLTCPAFQASCYLSPSPKGTEKSKYQLLYEGLSFWGKGTLVNFGWVVAAKGLSKDKLIPYLRRKHPQITPRSSKNRN